MKLITKFIDTTILGFTFLCKLMSRGFYFYFYVPFNLLSKIFKNSKFLNKTKSYYKNRQEQPIYFLVTSFLILFVSSSIFLINEQRSLKSPGDHKIKIPGIQAIKKEEESFSTNSSDVQYKEAENIFAKYSSMNINDVNILDLKQINQDIVAWLHVDGTNINYPILQTDNNDFYLENNIIKEKTKDGWPFMDYRNNTMMNDNNTIFYGHNLFNKTSFGSISNIFSKKWYKSSNHQIVLKTVAKKYTYEIFSCYETGDEVDYLQNIFYSDEEYQTFLSSITGKSKFKFNSIPTPSENIITLSTCNDDNTGRKVVHAKLINTEYV